MSSSRVAREHVPELDQQLAGDGGDADMAAAFSGPIGQGRGAPHPQNGLGPLDEEMAEVRPRPLLPRPSLIFLSLPLWRWPGLGPM
jgi:hypothetical protein